MSLAVAIVTGIAIGAGLCGALGSLVEEPGTGIAFGAGIGAAIGLGCYELWNHHRHRR
ncbi:MAG TPA: hypothetical protein VFE11_06865 [Dongiaceae bacterium]|jgi:hypothetical protein|nr:hypothetical protein [Dongiaceae bacterium]